MTALHAGSVLSDCKVALAKLGNAPDEIEQRLYWVLCCALLRSTIHVLKEVDARSSNRHLQRAINEWWDEKADKRKYPILWNFIVAERNNILKRYAFSTQFGIEEFELITEDGLVLSDEQGNSLVGASDFLKTASPVFGDKTPLQALTDAIDWIANELIAILRRKELYAK